MAKRTLAPARTDIGKRIRRLRESAGWSARKLSEKVGATHSVVSHIEAGIIKEPTWTLITAIASALNTTADYLVTGRRPKSTGTDG